jgi:hypothetical protein
MRHLTGSAQARLVAIAKARDAINAGAQGVTMYTVVGHQKGDLGLSMTSRYAGRETMEAKAACVRAVRLPKVVNARV